ncbi:hypothetical protein L1787_05550 [Acuticoccus sp. M5D2P5]|uniref:hypothetical protein n=1 Tax=Acuticoccus kalidii TaxID=2910977 RepID=UPI001F1ACF88|nr:hypothetical protein [Acuticoccus kalidii]MCF3932878.1 hypothetical protein [Acuticoccus kalidii]
MGTYTSVHRIRLATARHKTNVVGSWVTLSCDDGGEVTLHFDSRAAADAVATAITKAITEPLEIDEPDQIQPDADRRAA